MYKVKEDGQYRCEPAY
ncbi:hypothetical protein [Terrisporobacter othiniensis]|nr:hypothetical protein [Terrisporobacter othiniensis]